MYGYNIKMFFRENGIFRVSCQVSDLSGVVELRGSPTVEFVVFEKN
jgi:hypothetical protein